MSEQRILLFALIAITLLQAGCGTAEIELANRDLLPSSVVFTGKTSGEHSLQPDSALASAIRDWLKNNRSGWSKSMKTYAHGTTFQNQDWTLNFIDGGAVLNLRREPGSNRWLQLEKQCPREEVPFLSWH